MPQYEDVYEPPVMDATFAEKIDELKEVLAPPIPDFVSDAFSVSRAYAVGEYCIYENHFYKFTSAKSAGAWDSTKVQETTLAAEQSSTNASLTKYRGKGTHSFQCFPTGFVTTGGTLLSLFIPLVIAKDVTSVTLDKLDYWELRIPTGGYLPYASPDSSSISIVDGGIRIVLTKSGGWGVTNNIMFVGEITNSHFTITLS